MNTSAIYKKYLLDECLSDVKHRRNQWDESQLPAGMEPEREDAEVASLCELGGEDYGFYKFMMEGLREGVRKALIGCTYEVAQTKGIGGGVPNLGYQEARQYITFNPSGQPQYFEPVPLGKLKPIPGLFLNTEGVSTLYLFIEPSFTEFLPSRLENTLLTSPDIDRIKYVMLAEKDSPSPSMNWMEREGETIQGYKTYSLEEFYDDIFGHDEWEKLEECLEELKDCAADYCGISIVKALRQNSLRRFKLAIDVESEGLSSELALTDAQRSLLDARFTRGRAYTALTGTGDFAESFKTAEWLYKSLREVCDSISGKPSLVDLTPITASYFKAIEQYIFDYMALHTHERDNANRKLFVGNRPRGFLPSKDYQGIIAALPVIDGYIDITNQLMSPPFKEMLSLGLLRGFFGGRNQYGRLFPNNTDLLVDGAEERGGLYELVVDTLERVTTLRNGYFHKDNLHDWDKVDEVRDIVRFAFYLLLGAYKMTTDEENELGFDSGATLGDAYRLCDYINHRALTVDRILPDGSRVLPLFYCDEVDEPLLATTSDSATVYDQFGNPAYDGIHFKKLRPPTGKPDDDRSVFFDLANLPVRLSEGYLELINPDPFKNKRSGPLRVVFEQGQFFSTLKF